MTAPHLPSSGSQEYLWWSQGATDEANARNEGLTAPIRELRDVLEAFGRRSPEWTAEQVLTTMIKIYCPKRLRWRLRRTP